MGADADEDQGDGEVVAMEQDDDTSNEITKNKSATPKCVAKMFRRTQKKQKSAQLAKQKDIGKYSGRKKLRRSNMVAGRSDKSGRKSVQMKMAGAYKNIKQC